MANTYDVGDVVILSASFTTAAGAAVDPDTVAIAVRRPDGSLLSHAYGDGTLLKDSPGHYHADVPATMPGIWTYRWSSTGTGKAADEETFRVSIPAASSRYYHGSLLTLRRGETWVLPFASRDLTGWSKLWWTVKQNDADADAAAMVQVSLTTPADAVNDGLRVIAGAAATTKANGSIVVDTVATGEITVTVEAVETAKLDLSSDWLWDAQALVSGEVVTLASGEAMIVGDVTRAVV